MKPQLVIQDFGGTHNERGEQTSARLIKGASWKKQRTLTPKYLKAQQQQRDWYLRNTEKKRAYARARYQAKRSACLLAATEYRKKNPFYWRESHMRRLYGIEPQTFQDMLLRQKNRCGICSMEFAPGSKKTKPHIDHDHATNRVRGLLCTKCNVSLGHVEKKGFLEKALKYLGGGA